MDDQLVLPGKPGLHVCMSTSELIHDGQPFLWKDHQTTGFSTSQFRAAIANGDVEQVMDRVYADARADDTRDFRIQAAKLVVPAHAVICDETAAWLWGVDTHRPSDRHSFVPKWVVPHGQSRTRLDGMFCRQAKLPNDDIADLGGLAVTNPVRTTGDLLRKQWRPYAMASADAMAHADLVRPMDVRGHLAQLKGFPGIRQARMLSRHIESKSASRGESWTRLRLIDAGFPTPKAQVEVMDAEGGVRFLDLAYERRKIAIEYDGREFHTADADGLHDLDRRELIVATGYRFVVARYEQIFGTDDAFEREVGELIGMSPIARWW